MKQKIRLGDYYALTKHKLKQFKLQYISLLAVGMIMCLYAVKQVSAQVAEPAATGNILAGTVITAVTNLPVEGARLKIKSNDGLVFTGLDGSFEIVTEQIDGLLVVSYMGYETQEVPFRDGQLKSSKIRLTKDLSYVKPLLVGDSITDYLWDLPVTVVNHPKGRSMITLREYQNKLLVLDFWATWCKPCIKSVDKWEIVQKEIPDRLAVLTVHMDFAEKALPFIQKRGWSLPALIGEECNIVNRHFFNHYQVGGVVVIYEGKLLAIPKDKGYDVDNLRMLIDRQPMAHSLSESKDAYERRVEL